MTSGFNTGKTIVADIEAGLVNVLKPRGGKSVVMNILEEKGQYISLLFFCRFKWNYLLSSHPFGLLERKTSKCSKSE